MELQFFLLGDYTLYASDARVLTKSREFTEFQDEYFLQAFPSTVNVQSAKELLQRVRDINVKKLELQREALDRFLDLTAMVPSKDVDRLERRVTIDREKTQWTAAG